MNALAQVWHIAKKDMVEQRRVLFIYLIIVGVATAHAVNRLAPSNRGLDWLMMIVVLFGMLVVASLVQSDSPSRADSFWATRPIYPASMLGAKVVVVAIALIGVGLVGQAAGLIAHDAPADRMVGLLFESLWTYGQWLLMAMIIAAVTRDLRTFLVVIIALPVALVLLSALAMAAVSRESLASLSGDEAVAISGTFSVTLFRVLRWLGFMGYVAGPLSLIYLYRMRDTGWRAWAVATVGVTLTIASFGQVPKPGPSTNHLPAPAQQAKLEFSFPKNVGTDAQHLEIQVGASGYPPRQRISLWNSTVTLELRDGRTLRLPVQMTLELGASTVALDSSFTWMGGDPNPRAPLQAGVQITPEQRVAIAVGIKRAFIEGEIVALEAAIAGTMPLARGAVYSHHGKDVRIEQIAVAQGLATLTMFITKLSDVDDSALIAIFRPGGIEYVLLNDPLHQAVALHSTGGSNATGWFVLPGATTERHEDTFQSGSWGQRMGATLPNSWFSAAKLGVVEWKMVGRYPARAETVVSP